MCKPGILSVGHEHHSIFRAHTPRLATRDSAASRNAGEPPLQRSERPSAVFLRLRAANAPVSAFRSFRQAGKRAGKLRCPESRRIRGKVRPVKTASRAHEAAAVLSSLHVGREGNERTYRLSARFCMQRPFAHTACRQPPCSQFVDFEGIRTLKRGILLFYSASFVRCCSRAVVEENGSPTPARKKAPCALYRSCQP